LDKLVITGQNRLHGKVRISGAKNAAVAVIPAALLANSKVKIENLPLISDVYRYGAILRSLGAKVEFNHHKGIMEIDPKIKDPLNPPYELIKKLRASYYLLGVLLAKYGEAQVSLPGGCDIGSRPIDQHIKGFEALGAKIELEHGMIKAKASKLKGAQIYLDVVSVGATMNIMLAATLAEGQTIIENAAKEPHIVDVANFLNAMGARVKGAGTDVIKIQGVDRLKGCTHMVIPDQIEAGTYMIAAAATGGDVVIENVIPKHLDPVSAKLREAGMKIEEDGDYIRVRGVQKPKNVNIKTLPYPGFPTDLQQPITAFLSIANGTSIVTETVWESRFKHVDELKRMGANIKVEGRSAIIEGVECLSGAPVRATDLRAGAALLIAALTAEGQTEIFDVYHIDRGYQQIDAKLRNIGADIYRVNGDYLKSVAK